MAVMALVLILVQLVIQIGAVNYYSKSVYLQILVIVLISERVGKKNEQSIKGN